jgi:hypothetical protein
MGLARQWAVAAVVLAVGGGAVFASAGAAAGRAAPRAAADPVVAAAGDIACDPADPNFNNGNGTATVCRQKATAALLAGATAVLPLGDTQYEDGTYTKYVNSYARLGSWGDYLAVTRPAVGNHEYLTANAAGYFQYFGTRAGDPTKGYYSFDLGSWHLIALNSERDMRDGSAQVRWLHDDLARTTKPCILAYWHAPRFSSGQHGNDLLDTEAFWRELYAYRADVVLNGHDHTYERFGLQNPSGLADAQGIREFVVGTGGKNHTGFPTTRPFAANSQVRSTGTYGVLRLTLRASSYDWRFVPEQGKTFADSGTTSCHGPPTSVRPAGCRAGFWVAGANGRMRYVCLGRWRP